MAGATPSSVRWGQRAVSRETPRLGIGPVSRENNPERSLYIGGSGGTLSGIQLIELDVGCRRLCRTVEIEVEL